MGVLYNPETKKWSVNKEKIDHPTNLPESLTVYVTVFGVSNQNGLFKSVNVPVDVYYTPRLDRQRTVEQFVSEAKAKAGRDEYGNIASYNAVVPDTNPINNAMAATSQYFKENEQNRVLNQVNTSKNSVYDRTIQTASTTTGGDYTKNRDSILNLARAVLPANEAANLVSQVEEQYKTFYRTVIRKL
jgi:hypothetical protein